MGGEMRKGFLLAMACIVLLGFAVAGRATENGGGAYVNGAEGFLAGAVPPPGNYFLNYFVFYSAGEFKGPNAPPGDFNVAVTADVLRYIHVSDKKIFGGFWGWHVCVPLVNTDVTLVGQNYNKFALGDIIVDPVLISWHSKNYHSAVGVDVFVPTGEYDATNPASPGRNYWTFEPIYAFTFVSDKNFEVSAKIMYDINTKNSTTNYTSGQEFHFDYAVGQRIKNATVGLAGYYYQQMTKDTGTGAAPNGNKGKVFAIGPQVKIDAGNKMFYITYDKEFAVENRPEGGVFWLKFVSPI